MKHSSKSLVVAALAALAFGPAFADKGKGGGGDHGRGHDKEVRAVERHHGKHRDDGHRLERGERRLERGERVVIVDRDHLDRRHVQRSCPPGLAKKNNGCMPPGQAKRLVVGQALPPGAVFTVPQPVLSTLPPPPIGYRYAVVNNQVVLVSGSNIVVDIIRSLLG